MWSCKLGLKYEQGMTDLSVNKIDMPNHVAWITI